MIDGNAMSFDVAFDRLIGHEGGYVNNPADPGGETKWGISKHEYPDLDIANLTRTDARAIYLRDFWLPLDGALDGALLFQAFDMAVNHGIKVALRLLQRAAGVADDGNIGPVTRARLDSMSPRDLLDLYVAERLEFWARLSTWPTFGRGWARRAAANLRYAAADTPD